MKRELLAFTHCQISLYLTFTNFHSLSKIPPLVLTPYKKRDHSMFHQSSHPMSFSFLNPFFTKLIMQEGIFNLFLLNKLKIIFWLYSMDFFIDLLMDFKENLNTICTFVGAQQVVVGQIPGKFILILVQFSILQKIYQWCFA